MCYKNCAFYLLGIKTNLGSKHTFIFILEYLSDLGGWPPNKNIVGDRKIILAGIKRV